MNFGAPIFFYALAAVGIPIIIHLWSKNTKSKVPFGSIQFLKETETKTTRHLFPSEILLLAVRILLVGSLIALFAQPFIFKPGEPKTAYLLDADLDEEMLQQVKNDLQDKPFFWLSSERTSIEDPINIGNIDTWLSLREFGDFDSLVVYSQNLQSSFLSNLQSPKSKVKWIQMPVEGVNERIDQIQKDKKLTDLVVAASGDQVLFELKTGAEGDELIQNVFILADKEYQELANRIETAIRAIDKSSVVTFNIEKFKTASKPAPDDWVIWLKKEKPVWRNKLIYLNPHAQGLDRESERIYSIAPEISLEEMLLTNFPLQLETALLDPLNKSLNEYDVRTIPATYLMTGTAAGNSGKVKFSLMKWAFGLFLGLFLLERLLSQVVIKK